MFVLPEPGNADTIPDFLNAFFIFFLSQMHSWSQGIDQVSMWTIKILSLQIWLRSKYSYFMSLILDNIFVLPIKCIRMNPRKIYEQTCVGMQENLN